MRLCEYVFAIGLPFNICTQKCFLGEGFEGEDFEILCFNPQKALPCVKTSLLYGVSRVKIGLTAYALGLWKVFCV